MCEVPLGAPGHLPLAELPHLQAPVAGTLRSICRPLTPTYQRAQAASPASFGGSRWWRLLRRTLLQLELLRLPLPPATVGAAIVAAAGFACALWSCCRFWCYCSCRCSCCRCRPCRSNLGWCCVLLPPLLPLLQTLLLLEQASFGPVLLAKALQRALHRNGYS